MGLRLLSVFFLSNLLCPKTHTQNKSRITQLSTASSSAVWTFFLITNGLLIGDLSIQVIDMYVDIKEH